MGARKLKWTAEEEATLVAGVAKHGSGKWRLILKDPEFSVVLSSRSNIDLKDKWRNIAVSASGGGSREKIRAALKKTQQIVVYEENPSTITKVILSDEDMVDANPPDTDNESCSQEKAKLAQGNTPKIVKYEEYPVTITEAIQKTGSSKKSISRMELDNLVLESIMSLKEPGGSSKTDIAVHIEHQYNTTPSFNKTLSVRLKALTASGRLIKVNHKYKIASSADFSEISRNSRDPHLEERQRSSSEPQKVEARILTQCKVDKELAKMRTMTVQDAAAAAARAVAEAEAAMLEAEEAAKLAEAAEADAEEALAFAEAAMSALKNRVPHNLMVHV